MARGVTIGRIVAGIMLLSAGLGLSACQSGGGAAPVQELNVQGATTPIAGQTSAPTPGGGATPRPNANTTPGASIDVTPNEVTMGNVVLSLTVQPPQPVFDPSRTPSNGAANDPQKTPVPLKGVVVLGGSTLKVTNNFDGAQNPPVDQQREVTRHVEVRVKDKASGQLIPYIVVNMDLLREGRSVLQDQPLVPMLQSGADVSQMHYGNNVKFPGQGEYQVFVRMEPSPLLGSGSVGVAQFNISLR